jgi:hypothetical protein
VLATIYHVLEVDWRQKFHALAGRPLRISSDGQPIVELS